MKIINKIGIIILTLLVLILGDLKAQTTESFDKKSILDSLTTVDPEIRKYFPRWKVCEPDLQAQIYQAFVYYNYDRNLLDRQNIEIMAAPREFDDETYQILMISCGEISLNTVEIETLFGNIILGFLSGDMIYSGANRGEQSIPPKRGYCYTDIPIEVPFTQSQAETIINFLQPTNVTQAFTLSLFEQSLKIGETGFWLRSIYGNDEISYPFWYAGSAKIAIQRPLYVNNDSRTSRAIPYLINAYLGGSYRIESGLNPGSLMSWIPKRTLNNSNDGKMIAGFDFHMPFRPQFGINFNAEFPLGKLAEPYDIERNTYGGYSVGDRIVDNGRIDSVAPVLRTSGTISAFYHWWINPKNPENYIRFNLGINYAEVKELGLSKRIENTVYVYSLDPNVDGLITYHPMEFGDWVYAKIEYRNQAVYPFGFSAQYSNQTFLGDVWIPLFGNWLYLEAKYSTPLRTVRPYEIKNFFMISPLLRLTI